MPPKVKVTKQQIIDAAVEIVRQSGAGGINARTVANALNCSTQPVFSNFENMEDLRDSVVKVAETLYAQYTKQVIDEGKYPLYKATGMAYIRFAKEEKELFKLLFMRDRSSEIIPPFPTNLSELIQNSTGFNKESAEYFHLEMWAFVHGIATMVATNYLMFDTAMISDMLTDAYQGIRKHYSNKE